MDDGTCRTIKSQYQQTSTANFIRHRGGVRSYSERFFSGGLYGISVTLLAANHDAGVVEVYEEDKQIRSEPFQG